MIKYYILRVPKYKDIYYIINKLCYFYQILYYATLQSTNLFFTNICHSRSSISFNTHYNYTLTPNISCTKPPICFYNRNKPDTEPSNPPPLPPFTNVSGAHILAQPQI